MSKPNIPNAFGKALRKTGYITGADGQEEEVIPPGFNFVEVELDDGTAARWFIQSDRVNDIVDCLTTRLGEPETIRL